MIDQSALGEAIDEDPAPSRSLISTTSQLVDKARTEFFSDGVLAITITLLVIEIERPEQEAGHLFNELYQQWPSYLAFVISFIYIGVLWMNHHALFAKVRVVNRGLLWINLGILMMTALLPFPTAVLAEAMGHHNAENQHVAVALYALVAGLMSAAWIPVFPYLRNHPELLEPGTDLSYVSSQEFRPLVGVFLYLIAGAIAFVSASAGIVVLGLMIIFHAVTAEGVRFGRTRTQTP